MPSWPKWWLIFNAGSSSLKFAVWQQGKIRQRGKIEHLASESAVGRAAQQAMVSLARRFGPPQAVAHRIVQGGPTFWKPTRLTTSVMARLTRLTALAPLHLPANVRVVKLVSRHWPKVQQWGVFDTGLYHDLPDYVRLYSLPLNLANRYGIRKYGFHGISHAAAFAQACRRLRQKMKTTSGVTVHLGSGDSVTAWKQGRPIDTSMGFTPLEGLTMATRSGDLDPYIPLYLQSQLGWSAARVSHLLEQRSGLFGITGLRDVRDVLAAAGYPIAGWPRRAWTALQRRHARLGVRMFVYDIQRYLASYLGLLAQPSVIVFTGAIGQNAWIRRQVLSGLPAARGIRIITVPTDEEGAIAETLRRVVN